MLTVSQTTQPGPLGRAQLPSRPLPRLLSHLPSGGGSVPSQVSCVDQLQQAPGLGVCALQGDSRLSAPFIPDSTDLRGSPQGIHVSKLLVGGGGRSSGSCEALSGSMSQSGRVGSDTEGVCVNKRQQTPLKGAAHVSVSVLG